MLFFSELSVFCNWIRGSLWCKKCTMFFFSSTFLQWLEKRRTWRKCVPAHPSFPKSHKMTVAVLIGLRLMAKWSSNWLYILAVIVFACQEPERANRCTTATVKEGRPRGDVVFHILMLINTSPKDLGHLLCINLLINNSWCCMY